jgi:hypothetical protein
MRRLAWSQLRFRTGRVLALLAGMLVATTAFTVLTAAARTAQIRTIGTVNAHFQPAYDILVRPSGARSRLESATGTVQPDFLSGIYGGITMAQWNQISGIAGVQVAAPPVFDPATVARDASVPGHTVLGHTITAGQAYQYLLSALGGPGKQNIFNGLGAYWSAGPVSYRPVGRGELPARSAPLVPAAVRNPASVWESDADFMVPPMDNADSQYRALRQHALVPDKTTKMTDEPLPVLDGTFSPGKIATFDPLSQVPLGPYQPTVATPASPASRKALDGAVLRPDLNMGGLVTQPVQLITTLAALPTLENSDYTGSAQLARAPISVIRVRVAGVAGPSPASLNRMKTVAEQIELRTHLTVDIVAGSSPAPTTVAVPADRYGTPSLLLSEGWVSKGVAISILTAVDRSSVALFVLILVVCALFVANSATAAVRGRRTELGVLTCLGWTRPRVFATVLGEVTLIGLTAGILGALLSPPLAAALGLHASVTHAALAIPVALALALVAGAVPAALAARAEPMAAVRPAVLAVRRARQPSGVTGLAVVNVLRTPGRMIVGAVSLGVGVTALTLLVAVTLAFRGAVVGTLLGNVVTVQVRGVDYVAVAATVILGVLAVADALLISITERAPELATLRAFGWPEAALRRMVITEGALTGLAGPSPVPHSAWPAPPFSRGSCRRGCSPPRAPRWRPASW